MNLDGQRHLLEDIPTIQLGQYLIPMKIMRQNFLEQQMVGLQY